MENKSNPGIKEDSKQLEFKIFDSTQLEKENGQKTIFPTSPISSGPKSIQRLSKASLFSKETTSLGQSQKSINRTLKSLESMQDKFFSHTFAKTHLNFFYSAKKEIDSALTESDSIKSFIFNLIECNCFSQHSSFQLLIHEKGNSSAHNYTQNRNYNLRKDFIAVKDFNSIFNLIKKSKNKLFDQSNILKEELGALGTFSAKEFSLGNYNIILVVSRNDFLPPSSLEQNIFNYLCSIIPYTLTPILNSQFEDINRKNFLIALENYPYPLKITDQDGNIVFSNLPLKERSKEDKDYLLSMPIGDSVLHLSRDEFFEVSDIYHFKRISLLGELLNTLKHELSNPIFGLKLTAELLLSECEDDVAHEIISEILINAKRGQTIIRNFSSLYNDSSINSEINIRDTIQETLTLTKSATREIRKVVTCKSSDLESFKLNVNPTWLSQIIFNLILNSAQAIKSTHPRNWSNELIEVVLERNSEDILSIQVRDTGPGIEETHCEKIFSPFFTTKSEGTGLGLSICKGLAKKMGGNLKFSNNSSSPGTTFYLEIPIKRN